MSNSMESYRVMCYTLNREMFIHVNKILILVCVLILTIPLYAQNGVGDQTPSETYLTEAANPVSSKEETTNSFLNLVNKEVYASTIDEKEEKRILREKWQELLKVDVFYPYFKAKEAEDWVSEKTSVDFSNIKGRPKFEDNQIKYTFKLKF